MARVVSGFANDTPAFSVYSSEKNGEEAGK